MERNDRLVSGAEHAKNMTPTAVVDRAAGCLLGQLAGDSLGSLVEFTSVRVIRERYPEGLRDLADGGCWNTIAGQPTDDSEMALALARCLVERGTYDQAAVREAYREWLHSNPFDVGNTVSAGLSGRPNHESQANGALMRISPLGIFGARFKKEQVALWARQDAELTHPHPVCVQANELFASAIAHAVAEGPAPQQLYQWIRSAAVTAGTESAVRQVVEAAAYEPPGDYEARMGWVLIALQNALWQLIHAPNLESALIDTVSRGGDTDTNAAICGALLGAVYGRVAIPDRWVTTILNCRPEPGRAGVHHPRPVIYWPVDALELAERLVSSG